MSLRAKATHPMKPNPNRKAPALPKAKILFLTDDEEMFYFKPPYKHAKGTHHLVFGPIRKAQARELIRIASFFAMGEEEQRKTVAKIMSPDLSRVQVWSDKACDWSHQYTFDLAAAVLAAIKKGGRK